MPPPLTHPLFSIAFLFLTGKAIERRELGEELRRQRGRDWAGAVSFFGLVMAGHSPRQLAQRRDQPSSARHWGMVLVACLFGLVMAQRAAQWLRPRKTNSNKQNHSSFASLKKRDGKEINGAGQLNGRWSWLDVFGCLSCSPCLVFCGLWAGPPANAPQRKREQKEKTNWIQWREKE